MPEWQYPETYHNRPRGKAHIPKQPQRMQRMSIAGKVRSEGERRKGITPAYLARVLRYRRSIAQRAICERDLLDKARDDRAGICGRQGKARDAIYDLPRSGPGNELGEAKVCCHEPEETCNMDE